MKKLSSDISHITSILSKLNVDIKYRYISTNTCGNVEILNILNENYSICENFRNLIKELYSYNSKFISAESYELIESEIYSLLLLYTEFQDKWNTTYRFWLENEKKENKDYLKKKSGTLLFLHLEYQNNFPKLDKLNDDILSMESELVKISLRFDEIISDLINLKNKFCIFFPRKKIYDILSKE